jgi:hypothetical protein
MPIALAWLFASSLSLFAEGDTAQATSTWTSKEVVFAIGAVNLRTERDSLRKQLASHLMANQVSIGPGSPWQMKAPQ